MQTLADLKGSKWTGKAELWLDPAGNEAALSDCSLSIEEGSVRYTWSHEGAAHEGSLVLRDGGAAFTDTFHSSQPMTLKPFPVPGALIAVVGGYAAGPGPEWGWRITLSLRPSGELVLQMTNVTPWGEDGRAVRMTLTR